MRVFRNKTGSELRYERSEFDVGGSTETMKVSGTIVDRKNPRGHLVELLAPKGAAFGYLQAECRRHSLVEVV